MNQYYHSHPEYRERQRQQRRDRPMTTEQKAHRKEWSRQYYQAHKAELNRKATERDRLWRKNHPEKVAEYSRRWYQNHPEAARARNREQHKRHGQTKRLKRYGVTPDWYRQQLIGQAGRCAICFRVFASGKATHIDHDHLTGRVRGLLCNSCNTVIGLMGDDITRLKKFVATATLYLGDQICPEEASPL